jgi:hypothetical protein
MIIREPPARDKRLGQVERLGRSFNHRDSYWRDSTTQSERAERIR